MLHISIWQLWPYQQDFARLIGNVILNEHGSPSEYRVAAGVIVPAREFPEVFFLTGNLHAEHLLQVVADLMDYMTPELSELCPRVQLKHPAERWHLLLTANKDGVRPLEVARLSISPIKGDSKRYAAYWWARSAIDGKRRVEVRFREIPTCPSTVLRTMTAAMVHIGGFDDVIELYWDDLVDEESDEVSGGQG